MPFAFAPHLTREKRDTLFLLAVLAWTMLPHLQHLPAWTIGFSITLLGWRALLALRGSALPNRWVVIAALVVGAVAILATERTLFGRNAGVAMLVVLMGLKTLELSARRDAMVVFFLGFFLVLTNFLFSQSLFVAAAMLISVWGLLTGLTLAHMPNGHPRLTEAGLLAGRAALLGMPLMVLLFVLFPRIGPLWGVSSEGMGRTGLADALTMGSMAEIANDDSVALRVRFDGPAPAPSQLYFRGPVLSQFDGRQWRPPERESPLQRPEAIALRLAGEPLRYEITLEPSTLNLLPLLELTPPPATAWPLQGLQARLDGALQWRTNRMVSTRLRFSAQAWLQYGHGPTTPELWLREDVALPPGYNPRTLAWAAELRRDPRWAQADADALARMLMQQIRGNGFSYTMAPGTYGRDAVDEFWFDRKTGFCEHFATSFVVMMRALDVPARIVTGFQGADAEPVDGYTIVRQSHAHAWAEYWMQGRGWVRADPTAAVAPDRVQRGLPLAPQRGFVAGAIDAVDPGLLRSLRELSELMNNRWNQWVLDYSRQSQFKLLEAIGVSSPSWTDLVYAIIVAVSGGALIGAGWAFIDRRRLEPAQRMRQRMRAALGRVGVEMHEHDTPRALAGRVRARHGDAGRAVADALEALERRRYARDAKSMPDRPWWHALDAAVKHLQRTSAAR